MDNTNEYQKESRNQRFTGNIRPRNPLHDAPAMSRGHVHTQKSRDQKYPKSAILNRLEIDDQDDD